MSDQQTQSIPAVGFLVMAFTQETAGDDALKAMETAKKQHQFYFENAAVVRQDSNGKVHYRETGDMRSSEGAGVGALIGGTLGILGGPAGIALGAGAGAAIGATLAHYDDGFRNEGLKTVGSALKPGTSAVAAITSDNFLKAVQKQVSVENIRTFVSNLANEISARLGEGKNVALGLILTEAGLAFKEVAVDENSAQVVGMVITDDAVIAGGAALTADRLDYSAEAATEKGAAVEVGTVTKDGSIIVDDVATDEGEAAVVTVILPDDTTKETPVEADKPAEADKPDDKPATA
jgi:uncharacterized membrane protein